MQDALPDMAMLTHFCCPGSASPPNDATYDLQTTNSPFSFSITRKGASSNDVPLFSTKGQRLIFKVGKQQRAVSALVAGIQIWGIRLLC